MESLEYFQQFEGGVLSDDAITHVPLGEDRPTVLFYILHYCHTDDQPEEPWAWYYSRSYPHDVPQPESTPPVMNRPIFWEWLEKWIEVHEAYDNLSDEEKENSGGEPQTLLRRVEGNSFYTLSLETYPDGDLEEWKFGLDPEEVLKYLTQMQNYPLYNNIGVHHIPVPE